MRMFTTNSTGAMSFDFKEDDMLEIFIKKGEGDDKV